jgi:hypothetical protein
MQAALQGGAATSRPTPSSTNRSIARRFAPPKAVVIDVLPMFLARADEVIE